MLSNASVAACGGIEVIGALIDHLAQGLQKLIGWKEDDECCLKGADGIGKGCTCPNGGGGATCCNSGGSGRTTPCHDCTKCGTSASGGGKKCYLSAYCKKNGTTSSGSSSSLNLILWISISDKPVEVHLLARIFLGSVCLIWSGLSQVGFLTGKGSGSNKKRWSDSKLHEFSGDSVGLGSFMAAMGYDVEWSGGGSGEKGMCPTCQKMHFGGALK